MSLFNSPQLFAIPPRSGLGLRRWGIGLLLALVAAIMPSAANAYPRIVAEPASVALAPGSSKQVVVRIEGPIARNASLTTDSPASLSAVAKPLERHRRRQWIVTLNAGADFAEDTNLILRLRSGTQVSAIAIPVQVVAAPPVDTIVAMSVSFEGDTLLDGLDRPLLVRLSNLSDLPLAVILTPRLPNFLEAKGTARHRLMVAPRSTVIAAIPIGTAKRKSDPVISGKHEVAVTAALRRGDGRWTGQTAASTTLSVGVPGMEAVQGILQIPSFLLLPGFLFVAAYMLTMRAITRERPSETEKGSLLSLGWSAGHWLVAITISMAIVFAYPHLMRVWNGFPRNILYGFDLGDVIRVWVLSLLSGAAAALLVAGTRRLHAWWLARYAFNTGLAPLDLLDRLAHRRISTTLPNLVDANGGRMFCLLHIDGEPQAWATSAIAIDIKDRDMFDSETFATAVAMGEAADIAAILRKALAAQAVTVAWSAGFGLRGVGQVPAADFNAPEAKRSIVELA